FRVQLRALLRAARHGSLRILFPFVSGVEQLREARRIVAEATAELGRRGEAVPPVPIGVMIEIPAAALTAREVFEVTDFVSLGTNDLAQYVFAADRQVGAVAALNDPWQPALLRLIALVGDAARVSGKPAGVCGEAAADPVLACVLVGLGVSSLSMNVAAISRVGATLAAVDLDACQAAADAASRAGSPAAAKLAARTALGLG
ncbi:MAG TPA: putative PEP-binding protein, partial [Nakamurella sp.]